MSILYITHDGVTDHIGRSQVAPYVIGLARLGHRIHVLSAEKAGQEPLVDEYAALFAEAGVHWTRVRYSNRPQLLGQLWTQWQMVRAARKIVAKCAVRVLHCRSFLPALIGRRLKRDLGTDYIFDFRDFYADGGMQTRRFKFVFRWFKRLEGPLIREAAKVVCLTDRAAGILADWYFPGKPDALGHFQVVPCCADFTLFDPDRVSLADKDAARAKVSISPQDFVLIYLGSLGPDYLLKEMVALFQQVISLHPQAVFLFVGNNGLRMVEGEFASQGIDPKRLRFVSADRLDVPHYLSLANLSVIFIRPSLSKAGCSPTKLAELFACNVPVIANAGVGDLDRIVSPGRNASIIVSSFDDATLRRAVEAMIPLAAQRNMIRNNSLEFTLESGVRHYSVVYDELLDKSTEPQGAAKC